MCRKFLALALIVVSLNLIGAGSAYAGDLKEEKAARFAARVREGIGKLGTGTEVRVEVKLRDRTRLKGYVGEANADYFTVVDANGSATRVAYSEVKKVKGKNNLSGDTIALALVVAAFALVIVLIATGSR